MRNSTWIAPSRLWLCASRHRSIVPGTRLWGQLCLGERCISRRRDFLRSDRTPAIRDTRKTLWLQANQTFGTRDTCAANTQTSSEPTRLHDVVWGYCAQMRPVQVTKTKPTPNSRKTLEYQWQRPFSCHQENHSARTREQ